MVTVILFQSLGMLCYLFSQFHGRRDFQPEAATSPRSPSSLERDDRTPAPVFNREQKGCAPLLVALGSAFLFFLAAVLMYDKFAQHNTPNPSQAKSPGMSGSATPSINRPGIIPAERATIPATLEATDPEQILERLIKASAGPRAVASNGNQFAYDTAIDQMYKQIHDLYGQRVCWPMEVESIEQPSGITITKMANCRVRRNSETFYICVGSEPETNYILQVGGILRPLAIPITNDLKRWALSLRPHDRIKVTGTVHQIHYQPGLTIQSDEGHGFFFVLKQPTASSQ
jgi:hypothetical protein